MAEWSNWIEHDGKGCPPGVIGRFIHAVGTQAECEFRCLPGDEKWKGWYWSYRGRPCGDGVWDPVIRYRIRRPRGMEVLDSILTEIDQPVKERENA